MTPLRRKKWTEAEERTLLDKYVQMVSDGMLGKMKTREKKFRPIAYHVNSLHHAHDPMAYPWQWTWKDVSTKVQNMRHQYLLVKQKIKRPESELDDGDSGREEFDWMDGLTHWSNFLRYKEVFGDVALVFNNNDQVDVVNECHENGNSGFVGSERVMDIAEFSGIGHSGDGDFVAGIDEGENAMLGLGFDYDVEENQDNHHDDHNMDNGDHMLENGVIGFPNEEMDPDSSSLRKKRRLLKGSQKKAMVYLTNQLGQLKEMEAKLEQREVKREQERQKRVNFFLELEKERERKWEEREKERQKTREKMKEHRIHELEAMEKESDESWRRKRDEELAYKREWEDRMNRRRSEWKDRVDEMLNQHRLEMSQIQGRILQEQQNLTNQLLGIVTHWAGQPTGMSDNTGASSHYLSHMVQTLHHVNGMVHDDNRVDGDNQDDQFIVDGMKVGGGVLNATETFFSAKIWKEEFRVSSGSSSHSNLQ